MEFLAATPAQATTHKRNLEDPSTGNRAKRPRHVHDMQCPTAAQMMQNALPGQLSNFGGGLIQAPHAPTGTPGIGMGHLGQGFGHGHHGPGHHHYGHHYPTQPAFQASSMADFRSPMGSRAMMQHPHALSQGRTADMSTQLFFANRGGAPSFPNSSSQATGGMNTLSAGNFDRSLSLQPPQPLMPNDASNSIPTAFPTHSGHGHAQQLHFQQPSLIPRQNGALQHLHQFPEFNPQQAHPHRSQAHHAAMAARQLYQQRGTAHLNGMTQQLPGKANLPNTIAASPHQVPSLQPSQQPRHSPGLHDFRPSLNHVRQLGGRCTGCRDMQAKLLEVGQVLLKSKESVCGLQKQLQDSEREKIALQEALEERKIKNERGKGSKKDKAREKHQKKMLDEKTEELQAQRHSFRGCITTLFQQMNIPFCPNGVGEDVESFCASAEATLATWMRHKQCSAMSNFNPAQLPQLHSGSHQYQPRHAPHQTMSARFNSRAGLSMTQTVNGIELQMNQRLQFPMSLTNFPQDPNMVHGMTNDQSAQLAGLYMEPGSIVPT